MIKKTSSEEYSFLEDLEKECFFAESWSYDQICSHHESQNSLLFFPENQKEPTGYLLYLETNFDLEILRVGVLPSYRRKGIAEKLIDFLENLTKPKEIFLEVKSKNLPAIELYQKKGFKNITIRKQYYADGEDAILMKKESK